MTSTSNTSLTPTSSLTRPPNGVQRPAAHMLVSILPWNSLIFIVSAAKIGASSVWNQHIDLFSANYLHNGMTELKVVTTTPISGSSWIPKTVPNAKYRSKRIRVACTWLAHNAITSSVGCAWETTGSINLRQESTCATLSMMWLRLE